MTVDDATLTSLDDADLPGALRRLVDEDEIRSLIVRYCRLCDARQGTAWVREVFTEDGTDDHNIFGQAFTGWAEIEAMFAKSAQNLESTAHFVTNSEISVDGDTATARTYVQCWTWLRSSDAAGPVRPADFVFVGVYHDDLARTGDGWRITYRKMHRLGPGALGLGDPNPTYFAGYAEQ